jgi:hypothetical protein
MGMPLLSTAILQTKTKTISLPTSINAYHLPTMLEQKLWQTAATDVMVTVTSTVETCAV